MKAIQQYAFYQTKHSYWYETKESFDEWTYIVCNKVNKILSEKEAENLKKMERIKCRDKIISIIDNK